MKKMAYITLRTYIKAFQDGSRTLISSIFSLLLMLKINIDQQQLYKYTFAHTKIVDFYLVCDKINLSIYKPMYTDFSCRNKNRKKIATIILSQVSSVYKEPKRCKYNQVPVRFQLNSIFIICDNIQTQNVNACLNFMFKRNIMQPRRLLYILQLDNLLN